MIATAKWTSVLIVPFVLAAFAAGEVAGGIEGGGTMAWGQRIWALAFLPGYLVFVRAPPLHDTPARILLFIILEFAYLYVFVLIARLMLNRYRERRSVKS